MELPPGTGPPVRRTAATLAGVAAGSVVPDRGKAAWGNNSSPI